MLCRVREAVRMSKDTIVGDAGTSLTGDEAAFLIRHSIALSAVVAASS